MLKPENPRRLQASPLAWRLQNQLPALLAGPLTFRTLIFRKREFIGHLVKPSSECLVHFTESPRILIGQISTFANVSRKVEQLIGSGSISHELHLTVQRGCLQPFISTPK